jgi:predicted outer membrane repeat protein
MHLNFAVLIPGAASGGIQTIAFSQVSHNSASGKGGGILEATVDAQGMFTLPGNQLTLKFSQVKGNRAAQGGGIYAVKGSPVTLKFTLVIKNHPDNCFPPGSIRSCRY